MLLRKNLSAYEAENGVEIGLPHQIHGAGRSLVSRDSRLVPSAPWKSPVKTGRRYVGPGWWYV